MSAPISNVRPDPDQVLADIADYVLNHDIQSDLAYETRAQLPDRHAGLRPGSAGVPGVPQAAGPDRARHGGAAGRQGPRHPVPAGSGAGRLQHRRDDPLAGFQRHLAGRRMGPSVRQPGRHPGRRRLAVAHRRGRRQAAPEHARRAHRHDQGARDPGLHRAGELLQQGRPGSRGAGQGGVHRRGGADAGPGARRSHQRRVAGLGRRPEPAHLSSRAQHRQP